MADKYIENEQIKIGINLHGAELVSLVRKDDNREYMWCGDAKYWGRVSPVLFPFVGKLSKQSYRSEGKEYTQIPQHGFARDCEFEVFEQAVNSIWFKLIPSELMKEKYPYNVEFFSGYELVGKKVIVKWKVVNKENNEIHFSLGAHPAFNCIGMDEGKKYRLEFNTDKKELTSEIINSEGVLSGRTKKISLDNGLLEMSQELFSEDALVFDSGEITNATKVVSIVDDKDNKFLSVSFDAPALGIWSPVGKNAPFVCIEPWYGRCDRADFTGQLKDREYGNTLAAKENFTAEYIIEI